MGRKNAKTSGCLLLILETPKSVALLSLRIQSTKNSFSEVASQVQLAGTASKLASLREPVEEVGGTVVLT